MVEMGPWLGNDALALPPWGSAGSMPWGRISAKMTWFDSTIYCLPCFHL